MTRRTGTVHTGAVGELRVLVVDDDVAVPTLLAIDRHDLVVDEVARADAVSAAVRRAVPEAIVVDRWLPGCDGLDVVRRLRMAPATRQLPVVVAANRVEAGDESAALRAGADAVVSKPLDSGALVEVLHRLLALAPAELRVRRQRHLDLLRTTGSSPHVDDLPVLAVAGSGLRRWRRRGRGLGVGPSGVADSLQR